MISATDKARISAAIQQAEAQTAGEIFCVIARQSGDYRHLPLVWATAIALAIPAPAILAGWAAPSIYLAQLATFLAAAAILAHPALRIRLVPHRTRAERAHAEALRQFLAQGLDRTAGRTGVLIFASIAERHAEIVADAGINAKVPQQTWDQAIASLVSAIRSGHPADGFVAAITQCGAVLAQHFPPGTLDQDELPNRLVEI